MTSQNHKDKIAEYVKSRGQTRADDLWRHFKLSRVLIHRYLKELLRDGKLARVGKPPLVFYVYLNGNQDHVVPEIEISPKIKVVIENSYLYVSPLGEFMPGMEGFSRWTSDNKEQNHLAYLAKEYVQSRSHADSFVNRFGYINVTERIKNIFPETTLFRLYYLDFYSLPKFGKTKLGQLVLYAKQSQKIDLVEDIIPLFRQTVKDLIRRYKIDAIGFIPPTIPRKYQFQKEVEKRLAIKLPKIELVKAYLGDIPIAQKTLNKLEDRVTNARGSIFIKDETRHYQNVLLIDDAVGSGATLNETANKLKQTGVAQRVIGVAIVGSYKGFDVIQEI